MVLGGQRSRVKKVSRRGSQDPRSSHLAGYSNHVFLNVMQRTNFVIGLRHGVRGVGISKSGVSMLKHASFSAAAAPAATISSGSTSSGSTSKGIFASIFASVLDALHHSRRVQSRRVLNQYRHLMSCDDPRDHRQALDLLTLEGSEYVGH
jgi:hypothetical protein